MTDTTSELLAYVAKSTGGRPDGILDAVRCGQPDFLDCEYLDAELLAVWPKLPAEARLVAWLMAKRESDRAAERWE
jgi:hypothetical protein